MTSNIALSDWGRYLGDTTVAMAILDRLAMNAIRIDINGPSYRQHVADLRAHKPPAPKADAARRLTPRCHPGTPAPSEATSRLLPASPQALHSRPQVFGLPPSTPPRTTCTRASCSCRPSRRYDDGV